VTRSSIITAKRVTRSPRNPFRSLKPQTAAEQTLVLDAHLVYRDSRRQLGFWCKPSVQKATKWGITAVNSLLIGAVVKYGIAGDIGGLLAGALVGGISLKWSRARNFIFSQAIPTAINYFGLWAAGETPQLFIAESNLLGYGGYFMHRQVTKPINPDFIAQTGRQISQAVRGEFKFGEPEEIISSGLAVEVNTILNQSQAGRHALSQMAISNLTV